MHCRSLVHVNASRTGKDTGKGKSDVAEQVSSSTEISEEVEEYEAIAEGRVPGPQIAAAKPLVKEHEGGSIEIITIPPKNKSSPGFDR